MLSCHVFEPEDVIKVFTSDPEAMIINGADINVAWYHKQ